MKIGNVELKSNLIAAPIAGFSDAGFRSLCASYGAGLTYTEMVSAKGICYGNKGTDELLYATSDETVKAVQLFGSDPEFMFKAAGDERLKKFDIIDINIGCPVKKIFGNGDGSALMKNPALIEELVSACAEGSGKPVTVKLRAGITDGQPSAVECAVAAEKGGASAVTVHARYRDQFYAGQADHNITRLVKEAVKIPVVANGDIADAESLDRVREISGADGFMIARGALGRPFVFAELNGKPCEFDAKNAINRHISVLLEYFPEKTVANRMKLHLCYYAKGGRNAKSVRTAVSSANGINDIYAVIETYF